MSDQTYNNSAKVTLDGVAKVYVSDKVKEPDGYVTQTITVVNYEGHTVIELVICADEIDFTVGA